MQHKGQSCGIGPARERQQQTGTLREAKALAAEPFCLKTKTGCGGGEFLQCWQRWFCHGESGAVKVRAEDGPEKFGRVEPAKRGVKKPWGVAPCSAPRLSISGVRV